MTTIATGYLIQPTDDAALRPSFLEAMTEHERIDGKPDADGLSMTDLRGRTCLTHYTQGLRDGTALRPGTEPMTQTVWWFIEGMGNDREYLGRVSMRQHPATEVLGEPGSQLWVTVRPSRRRQGIGRCLIAEARNIARAKGMATAVVELDERNEAGRRLIAATEAQPIEHRPAERAGRRRYVMPTA
ncbi:GNAT family N-acetyltransferase [Actinomadura adrarensis]|uniref:GNAT family N-acetyltransferase n=1 Tax=Actinomadura adrarensis TaxID=1819600 RepID=A0ABW3CV29_9ACTN